MPKLVIKPGAAVLAGLLFYFIDPGDLLPILLPVVAHELGHCFTLRMFGCRITGVEAEIGGLFIRFAGELSKTQEVMASAAGPLAGLLYAAAAKGFGQSGLYSAGISLLLTAVNLIPCLPLDGGRIASALLGARASMYLGHISAVTIAMLGAWLFVTGRGAALLLTGILLLSGLRRSYGSSSAMSPD